MDVSNLLVAIFMKVLNSLVTGLSRKTRDFWGYLGVRTCELFLCFVAIIRVRAIMLTSLLSLFYVTGEFHRFLNRGRTRFLCVWLFYCRLANGGAKISIKPNFMRSFFCLSVFSSGEVLGKITSIRSKLLTAACWSREEKRGNCEANLLYHLCRKRLRYHRTTDKSFTVFFAH